MKRKLLLFFVLFLFILPLSSSYANTIQNEIKKVEKSFKKDDSQINKKIDSLSEQVDHKRSEVIVEYKQDMKDLEADILNKVYERFEIRDENLKYKEAWADRMLVILGGLIAFFGVAIPILITIATLRISKKHSRELEKIKKQREKQEEDFSAVLNEVRQKAKRSGI